MKQNILHLKKPIHKNKLINAGFDLDSEEYKHLLDKLVFSIDGSILGIEDALIKGHLKDPKIKKIRYGIIEMPKKFDLKNENDFLEMMAILMPLDQAF